MTGSRVLVANAGTLRVFQTSVQLDKCGLLRGCATSLYFGPGAFGWAPTGLRKRLEVLTENRRCASLSGRVRTHSLPELVHLAAARLGLGSTARLISWRNREFCRWVGRECLEGIDLVWSFDTSSLEIFEAAKARGIGCILDVSIAHPALGNRILAEHSRMRPEYAADLVGSVSVAEMVRRVREMELADCLVAGSSFVADSLVREGVPAKRIRVNPYGVDLKMFGTSPESRSDRVAPVFLFVGWFSQRKGIYYLLEAWERAGLAKSGAVLRLAGGGRKDLPHWAGALPQGVELLGRVPHRDLPAVFSAADVFVFPSLFEGFAKVILEAMASGLPVITTPNACDAAAVVDGENGLVTPVGDVASLAEAMRALADDEARRKKMGERSAAIARAYSWEAYGERCREICEEVSGARPGMPRRMGASVS